MITSDSIKTLTHPLKLKEKIFMSDFCSVNDSFFFINIYENSLHAVTTTARGYSNPHFHMGQLEVWYVLSQ